MPLAPKHVRITKITTNKNVLILKVAQDLPVKLINGLTQLPFWLLTKKSNMSKFCTQNNNAQHNRSEVSGVHFKSTLEMKLEFF